jgi:hypothetical protein
MAKLQLTAEDTKAIAGDLKKELVAIRKELSELKWIVNEMREKLHDNDQWSAETK